MTGSQVAANYIKAKSISEKPTRVGVFGDFMVDCDVKCQDLIGNKYLQAREGAEMRPGGAGAVAMMLAALGCDVACYGFCGGHTLRDLLAEKCETSMLADGKGRPISKTRLWLKGKPFARIDNDHSPADRELFDTVQACREAIAGLDVIVICDHGKGGITSLGINRLIEAAGLLKIPVLVDPAINRSLTCYYGATLIKLNTAEAAANNYSGDCRAITSSLAERMKMVVVLTMGSEGLYYAKRHPDPRLMTAIKFRCEAKAVVDECGAGDMVMAIIAACTGLDDFQAMMALAATASAKHVGMQGAVPIPIDELMESRAPVEPKKPTPHLLDKVIGFSDLARISDAAKFDGRKVVLTNGCFDLLHAGHVHCLQHAKAAGGKGAKLIVLIDDDVSIANSKGAGRPIVPQGDRLSMVAALECVDYVCCFISTDLYGALQMVKPDFYVKGGTTESIRYEDFAIQLGAKVIKTDAVPSLSTTALVNKILAGAGQSLKVEIQEEKTQESP